MRFSGTTDAALVNAWLRHMLCKELRPHSTLIFDNAAFHKKKDLEAIAQENGHQVLFLPPYSPDLNPIEHDFANLKKRRQFAPSNTSLADLIKSYGNNQRRTSSHKVGRAIALYQRKMLILITS